MMKHLAATPNAMNRVEVSLLEQVCCTNMEIYFHAITQLTNPPLYDILSRVMQKQIRHHHHLFAQPLPRVG